MHKQFTAAQIYCFKREAKSISKTSGLSHSHSLDFIAKREGFSNWPMLLKNSANSQINPDNSTQLTPNSFHDCIRDFIEYMDQESVDCICRRNGSIWVQLDDVILNELDDDSFIVLGKAQDGAVKEYASRHNLVLVVDYDGMADRFVSNTEIDFDEDDEIQPEIHPSQQIYTMNIGREAILKDLEYSVDFYLEKLEYAIDDASRVEAN